MFLNPIIRTQNKPLLVVNKSNSTDWLPDDEVDAAGMPHTNPFTYVANVPSGQQIYGSNTSTPGCKLISAIAGGSAIVIINNGMAARLIRGSADQHSIMILSEDQYQSTTRTVRLMAVEVAVALAVPL